VTIEEGAKGCVWSERGCGFLKGCCLLRRVDVEVREAKVSEGGAGLLKQKGKSEWEKREEW
jgi:hypothetical protein